MVAQPPVEEISPLRSKASLRVLGNGRLPIQGGAPIDARPFKDSSLSHVVTHQHITGFDYWLTSLSSLCLEFNGLMTGNSQPGM